MSTTQPVLVMSFAVVFVGTGAGRRLVGDVRGAALIVALLATMLLSALAGALILASAAETRIAANYRSAQQSIYAADAALERGVMDLLAAPNWDAVLAGVSSSSFVDGGGGLFPDGTPVNIGAMTMAVQAETDLGYGADPNRPVWRLFAHETLASLLPAGGLAAPDYLLVWVADDDGEVDGDPAVDTNGLVLIRAEAHGEGASRKVVEAAVTREFVEPEGGVPGRWTGRLVSWREVR